MPKSAEALHGQPDTAHQGAHEEHIRRAPGAQEAPADEAPMLGQIADLPTAAEDEISFVVDALRTSERPLLIVGGGCTEAEFSARSFAEATGVAVFCTYAGRGVIDETNKKNWYLKI